MHQGGYAYGNWAIVVTMIMISLFFIFRFLRMRASMHRRSGGALIAFIIALFTEMYGFPLTIYFLSHFLRIKIPLDHISGHLLGDLLTYLGLGNGWAIVMIVSNVLLFIGIWLVSVGWEQVYKAQGRLVTNGAYAYMRHPQYTGIYIITLGFMIQWPTLTTLILWPFVILIYYRLAQREERAALEKFPNEYRQYMARTAMFFPRLSQLRVRAAS
ncbi:MAG: isoprenylcysteine carboxylmethyltransferase family protein [Sedimentisphaerales bacterium]|nr:isoprenylcysteine carboxylmethyltransferase family protein [Sedimentisphaerales bacterium]